MKRILKLSALAGAIVAAALVAPTSPVSAQGYYYRGRIAPSYGGYSGYRYNPYGNGGYSYVAPSAYVTPPYRSYGYGTGLGVGVYGGSVYQSYGGTGFYVQPYQPTYNPYGYGGYGF